MKKYVEWGRETIEAEIEALSACAARLDESFSLAAREIAACKGKVIVSGVGKSGRVGEKMAATFASLGCPSFFMHAGEALHGDSGMMDGRDLLIVVSNSGETVEAVATARKAKELGLKVIAMTGRKESAIAKIADATIDIGVEREADPLGLAPTSSSTVTMAVGDALAVAVARAKGFSKADFAARHPGGALGKISSRQTGGDRKK